MTTLTAPQSLTLTTWFGRFCPPCARLFSSEPIPRISAEALHEELSQEHDFLLLDLRHPLDLLSDSRVIPGSIRVRPQDLEYRLLSLPKDTAIVAYCALTGEAASERAARNLRKRGYSNVGVLAGGFMAWRERGYELADFNVAAQTRQILARAQP